MADQTVTARLKIEADASGAARAVSSLTGEVVKLTKAEKAVADAVHQRGAAYREADTYRLKDDHAGRNDTYGFAPGHVPPSSADLARQAREQRQAERQKAEDDRRELFRRQWQAAGDRRQVFGTDASPLPGTPAHYDQLAAGLRERHEQRQQEARELRSRGLNADGSAITLGGRLARFAAPATAVAYAMGESVRGTAEAFADPFVSGRMAGERALRNVPLGVGYAQGMALDVGRGLSGETARFGSLRGHYQLQSYRQSLQNQADLQLQGIRFQEQTAGRQVEAFKGFRLDRPDAGIDRSTSGGRRQYEDEARLLPIRQQLTKLATQQEGVRRSVIDAMDEEKKLAGELRDLDEKRAAAQRRAAAAGDNGAAFSGRRLGSYFGFGREEEQRALNELDQLNKQRAGKQAQLEQAVENSKVAKGRFGEVEKESAQQSLALRREQYAIAQEREQGATDKSVSLSRMGVGGRETAKIALELADQVGIENLPPELRNAIGAVAPRKLRELEEKDGDRYKAEFRGLVGEGDKPDFDSNADARKRTDKARERVIEKEEQASQQEAEVAARPLQGFGAKVAEIVKRKIDAEVEALRTELGLANLNQK